MPTPHTLIVEWFNPEEFYIWVDGELIYEPRIINGNMKERVRDLIELMREYGSDYYFEEDTTEDKHVCTFEADALFILRLLEYSKMPCSMIKRALEIMDKAELIMEYGNPS